MPEAPSRSDAPAGWVRSTLELAIMAVLTEADRHGYALAQRLADAQLGPVRGGALYPVLGRLEADGAVLATWHAGEGGPGRKVYSLTDAGRRRLAADRTLWREFATSVEQLLAQTAVER